MSFLIPDYSRLQTVYFCSLQWVNNGMTILENIAQWIFANRLSLNLDKTNFILFSNSISDLPGNIYFNNVKIKKVKSTKFLGLFIDDRMSWKIHTNYLCLFPSRNAGVIYKLKLMFPPYVLQMLYSTLMLPYLNYGILAWGSSLKLQLEQILVVQKKSNTNNLQCTYSYSLEPSFL